MQLRIPGPRRAMPECGGHEPAGRLHPGSTCTAPHRRRRPLRVAECLADRSVVRASYRVPNASSPRPNRRLTLFGAENVRS